MQTEIEVPSNHIYIWNDEGYDHSRWITIAHRGTESCVLHLTDICQPGKVSRLASVNCPQQYLQSVISAGGSLQLTLSTGFLLIQCHEDVVNIEFRGTDELSSIKASFKLADFEAALSAKRQVVLAV